MSLERKIVDAALVNHLSEGNVGGFEQRCGRGDFDGFRSAAELEREIDTENVVHADLNGSALELLKTGEVGAETPTS